MTKIAVKTQDVPTTVKLPTLAELLNSVGKFSWSFGMAFFIETPYGNFQWLDPDYDGDNTVRPFLGDYQAWIKFQGVDFGRDKGQRMVHAYCGDDIVYQPDSPIDPKVENVRIRA